VSAVPPLTLRLPATSANLGPGFDAVALAMGLALEIAAEVAPEFRIDAVGRNPELCGALRRNLMLDTYTDVLAASGRTVTPLYLRIDNGIPLGMGCGSSAAALLAGVHLANHFGGLGWSLHACMEEACRREGHPDNVAACALGYLTVSASVDGQVVAATCGEGMPWRLFLALPEGSLATEKARALLPDSYSRADAVLNVQRTGLLVAAFAQGRGELLVTAMEDRMHQPYRRTACPLLPLLLPLAGTPGILGVALSGAGPGVLLIGSAEADPVELRERILAAAGSPQVEIVETKAAAGLQFL
jgi:homoserine kinase